MVVKSYRRHIDAHKMFIKRYVIAYLAGKSGFDNVCYVTFSADKHKNGPAFVLYCPEIVYTGPTLELYSLRLKA